MWLDRINFVNEMVMFFWWINLIFCVAYIILGVIYVGITDSFLNKVEKKTNVSKESILSLASRLKGSNLKDEKKDSMIKINVIIE